jgi:hypothetical protein
MPSKTNLAGAIQENTINTQNVGDTTKTFDLTNLATQAPMKIKSLETAQLGESIVGTIVNVQPMQAINGKPVCRIYVHIPEFNVRYNALLDGTLHEVLPLKGIEITLTFRGVNVVNGNAYAKFSTLF